jgi:hypothetical protein
MLEEFLEHRQKKEEEDYLAENEEWDMYFTNGMNEAQKAQMFERRLGNSKLNNLLVSVFALTGACISAYEVLLP